MNGNWQVITGHTDVERIGQAELLAALQAVAPAGGGRLLLGTPASNSELASALKRDGREGAWAGLRPDGYLLRAVPETGGTQVVAAGRDARGVLYAAFDLGARIREGLALEPLDLVASPFCRVREVSTAIRDHDFLAGMIRTAFPRYRMNSLHLWSVFPEGPREFNYYMGLPIAYRRRPHIRAMREASAYFREGCARFSALLDVAAEYHVDVNITFCVLSHIRIGSHDGTDGRSHGCQALREDFPELPWRADGWAELDSDAAGALVREQLDELFETYPKLGGVLFHAAEMAVCGFSHTHHDRPDGWNERVTRRMLAVVDEVCRKHDRYLYLDLHGLHPGFLAIVRKALRSGRYPRFAAKNESTAGEQSFGSAYPSFPAGDWAPTGAPVLLNHDVGFEGMDFPWIPVILTGYIERHVRYAASHGVDLQGAMLYNYTQEFVSYRTLAEINLLTLDALMWEPGADTGPVWDRWLRRVFGPDAAEVAGAVLRQVPDILGDILYVENKGTLGLQYAFPPFEWTIDGFAQAVEWFQPAGTRVVSHPFNLIADMRTVPVSAMLAEKDRAIASVAACLERIERERHTLGENHYQLLAPRFLGLLFFARAARLYVESLWAFSNGYIRRYDPACVEPAGSFRAALAGLRALAREMREEPRMRWLEPRIYYSPEVNTGLYANLYADSFIDFLPRRIERFADDAETAAGKPEDLQWLRDKFEANARRPHGAPVPHGPVTWAGLGDAARQMKERTR